MQARTQGGGGGGGVFFGLNPPSIFIDKNWILLPPPPPTPTERIIGRHEFKISGGNKKTNWWSKELFREENLSRLNLWHVWHCLIYEENVEDFAWLRTTWNMKIWSKCQIY